jgi:hypothetical protein
LELILAEAGREIEKPRTPMPELRCACSRPTPTEDRLAEFLNFPLWGNKTSATLCCKVFIQLQRAGKGIRAPIRENTRRRVSKNSGVGRWLQIPRAKEPKFIISRDAKFGARGRVARAL